MLTLEHEFSSFIKESTNQKLNMINEHTERLKPYIPMIMKRFGNADDLRERVDRNILNWIERDVRLLPPTTVRTLRIRHFYHCFANLVDKHTNRGWDSRNEDERRFWCSRIDLIIHTLIGDGIIVVDPHLKYATGGEYDFMMSTLRESLLIFPSLCYISRLVEMVETGEHVELYKYLMEL